MTLCDPTDCSPPGSSVREILQATILEWVATPLSRGSSRPRDETWVSCIAGRFFTIGATFRNMSGATLHLQGLHSNDYQYTNVAQQIFLKKCPSRTSFINLNKQNSKRHHALSLHSTLYVSDMYPVIFNS